MLSRLIGARLGVTFSAVLALAALPGCGRSQQSASTISSADGGVGMSGDESDDDSMDLNDDLPDVPSDSLLLEDADGGQRVMTVFFKGGRPGDKCVNWDVRTYASEGGLTLIKPKRLERRHEDAVKQLEPNEIWADLKTVGGRDGYKAFVKDQKEIMIFGTVSNCDNTVTLDINTSVKAVKGRTKQIWEGDPLREGGVGKVKLFVKISKVKKAKKRGGGGSRN